MEIINGQSEEATNKMIKVWPLSPQSENQSKPHPITSLNNPLLKKHFTIYLNPFWDDQLNLYLNNIQFLVLLLLNTKYR